MRLNQFLAAAGLGSRRACEQLILDGKISVNGHIVVNLATRIAPQDRVAANGKLLMTSHPLTLALNKPKGIICSTAAQSASQTVFDLLPPKFPRLFYVGRLDVDTSGLLILTNRGDLAQQLTHPKFKLKKIYHARLDRPFDFKFKPQFLKGFRIEPGFAKCEALHARSKTELEITLAQGLKRQIRLMFAKYGYHVVQLKRVQIGALKLDDLKSGQWKILNPKELQQLTRASAPARIARARSNPAQPS